MHIPPPADTDKRFLTVWADEGHPIKFKLLTNVLSRIRERGRLLDYSLGIFGDLWCTLATDAQAERCRKRLDGVKVCGNTPRPSTLRALTTAPADWPPTLPRGAVIPVPAREVRGSGRSGAYAHRGGSRHGRTAYCNSWSCGRTIGGVGVGGWWWGGGGGGVGVWVRLSSSCCIFTCKNSISKYK